MEIDDPWAQYEMLEELGSGSFGVVYKARERSTRELVAIKHIDLDGTDDDIRDIQQEISLLSTCASPFVTKYKTSFVRGVKLWIVMEYLGGGSCLDLVKERPFDEASAAIVCRELLLGLDYLHGSGKIHRDIKAANILLSGSGKVKIADFGVAAQLTNIKSQRMTFVGTPYWMAPEVIQEEGYDFRADIWSLGITAMELVNGEPPNAEMHPMKALFHIPKAPAPRPDASKFSRDFRSFVSACLVKDAEHRPTARDLLQHRFIQKAGRVSALRGLIESRQRDITAHSEKSNLRYYEETLRDMSPAKKEADDWVFDTIKPVSTPQQFEVHTIKKRKLSETVTPSMEPPHEMMERLDLNNQNTPSEPTFTPVPSDTVRMVQRRQSVAVATARKVSSPMRRPSINRMTTQPAPVAPSGPLSPTPSRRQSIATVQRRQPLGPDTSFGNSPSSSRPFRRISHELSQPPPAFPQQYSPTSAESKPPQQGQVSPHIDNLENIPPPAPATSKEAKLGRKIFARIVDPAFQSTYAQTAGSSSREALARVGLAWSTLDAVDPEGGVAFLRAIVEKLGADAKLSNALIPGLSSRNSSGSGTPLSRATSSASAMSTPQATPTRGGAREDPGRERRQDREHAGSPTKNAPAPPQQPPPTSSPAKLILAQSNPHLASHARRRQSSVSSLVSASGAASNEKEAASTPSTPTSALSRSPSKRSDGASRSPTKGLERSPSKLGHDHQQHLQHQRSPSKLDRSPSKAKRESMVLGAAGGGGVDRSPSKRSSVIYTGSGMPSSRTPSDRSMASASSGVSGGAGVGGAGGYNGANVGSGLIMQSKGAPTTAVAGGWW